LPHGQRYAGAVTLTEQMTQLARQAKEAARALARFSTADKNACLRLMADALESQAPAILTANANDVTAATQTGLSPAMLDRLRLDTARLASVARGLREVAALPDPVGRLLAERTRPNGLRLRKVATPIGVIVVIFESRPNVTADAASLCFKSGNAVILRGGKEAMQSNQAIAAVMVAAAQTGLPAFPPHAIQLVPTTDREAIRELLALTQYVDLCLPRGGEGLICAVADCAKVPVIKHYRGVCHVFVDRDADLDMAEAIAVNAKLQRPAVCNAMETLLVDEPVAAAFLPRIARRFAAKNVICHVDDATRAILNAGGGATPTPPRLQTASEADWFTEYNDYVVNVRVVAGVEEAIAHINHYGSAHSDSIVTRHEDRAHRFLAEVDSAAVYWNASTRFTDGGEFGLGAEIGISTDKVGARGPMGLEELTSYKWLGLGTGQVRT
jgi:glutamate-5-semialdehyde dehydrogenase